MRLYNMFPMMRERPESKNLGFGLAYWFVYLIGLPAIFNILSIGGIYSTGANILYLLIHFVALLCIYGGYLRDSWTEFRFSKKATFKYIGIGLCIFTGVSLILALLGLPVVFPMTEPNAISSNCAIPIGDLIPNIWKVSAIFQSPLLFWLVFVAMVPFITSLLYQATVFCPICTERPWLAYLILSVVVAIPFLMKGIRMLPMGIAMLEYLAVLPFYLCAAWIYEKTNTIWAPIIFQAIINAIGTPLMILCFLLIAFA